MPFKRILSIILVGCMLFGLITVVASGGEAAQASAQAGQKPKSGEVVSIADIQMPTLTLACKGAVLMSSDTGEVLYDMQGDTQMPIASITKVMTLLLTLEAVEKGKISMTDIVPISDHAYGMGGSQIWLEPGEQFTLDELIKAICISSANDAAVAVAEFVGGSEPIFVEMMNTRAAELGMQNTHFVNACGLDADGHLSSAKDVAIMSRELLRHPKILEYSGIWMDSLRGGQTQLTNTNKLLKRYSGVTGLKTGTTGKAGVCITATAQREGMGLIAVVLGSANSEDRFASATAMLDYGFSAYEVVDFPVLEGLPATLPVSQGIEKEVEILANLPKKLFVNKGEGKGLSLKTSMEEALQAPIKAGDTVGKIQLIQAEKAIFEYNIQAKADVEKIDFKRGLQLLWQAVLNV